MSELSHLEKLVFGENATRGPDGRIIEAGIGAPKPPTEAEAAAIAKRRAEDANTITLKLDTPLREALQANAKRIPLNKLIVDICSEWVRARAGAKTEN